MLRIRALTKSIGCWYFLFLFPIPSLIHLPHIVSTTTVWGSDARQPFLKCFFKSWNFCVAKFALLEAPAQWIVIWSLQHVKCHLRADTWMEAPIQEGPRSSWTPSPPFPFSIYHPALTLIFPVENWLNVEFLLRVQSCFFVSNTWRRASNFNVNDGLNRSILIETGSIRSCLGNIAVCSNWFGL